MNDRAAPPEPNDLRPATREDIEKMSLSLYANGKLIPVSNSEVRIEPTGEAHVVFHTTVNAMRVGADANPKTELMWGGVRTDDIRYIRQPKPDEPGKFHSRSGTVKVIDIITPANEGDPVLFRVHAMTDVYDWLNDGEKFASAGDEITVPATWIQEK